MGRLCVLMELEIVDNGYAVDIQIPTAPPVANLGLAVVGGPPGAVGPEGPVGPVGPTGPAGPIGATGPVGPVGATGPVGPQGPQGLLGVAGVEGPQGPQGIQGIQGLQGAIGPKGDTGAASTVPGPMGPTGAASTVPGPVGPAGADATVSVGTVTTVSPTSSASVTNVGTAGAAVFNFSIPKGETGEADETEWSSIVNRPAVVAAGATEAIARDSIDAEYTGNKGVGLGYASLDAAGKVPYSQLPSSIMSYQGVWNPSTNTPTLADGTGDQGDTYRVSGSAAVNLGSGSISFNSGDYIIYNGASWEKSDGTDGITSVAGKTGTVVLVKSDVGLSDVDNTSDAAKPISTAAQTALDGKEPTITAGASSQYWRGDKTFQTLDKSTVGLGNVDNTSDANKPISSATQTALDGKEPTVGTGAINEYWRGDKTWQTIDKVSLEINNVNNTSDLNKPISTATQTALDAKQSSNQKGQANGYASLNASARVPVAQLPDGMAVTSVLRTDGYLQFYSGEELVGGPVYLDLDLIDGGSAASVSLTTFDGGAP